MASKKWLKINFFPLFILLPLALAGLFWEGFNLYFRGLHTPFLYPALGLILLSLFFWIKNKWAYLLLLLLTAGYMVFFLKQTLWTQERASSVVYYYRNWSFDTFSGLIHPKQPIGPHPPDTGAYLSCNYSLDHWRDYLNLQPRLCTFFDEDHRLMMFLNDTQEGDLALREFQMNYFNVPRKSLLGETLDRWALRLAYRPPSEATKNKYQLLAIYQVYERQIDRYRSKIVESFSRKPDGSLETFTESPLLKFTQKDVYALYGFDGELIEIPNRGRRNYSFPARIDVRGYESYDLPETLRPFAGN